MDCKPLSARHVHYAEPYFGSGGVFFNKQSSAHEVINDLDGRVMQLCRVVRTRGLELARAIKLTPYARAEYYESYSATGDELEDARRFMVRCWMAHGFKPYCRTGWRHNGSKSLQPITTLWNDLPARIEAVIDRLKNAEIESVPALAIVERYKTADTLLYLDPPYVLSTRRHKNLYAHEMTDADHMTLLDAIDEHPGPVVLSGYHSQLYDERLAHWHTREKTVSAEKGQSRTEVLWLNQTCIDRLGFGPMFDLTAA
jgi:DNA adenine methylase